MAECGKCPACGAQMKEERVYTLGRMCRCPECGQRTAHPKGPLSIPKKAIENAFKEKEKEK